MQNYKKDVTIWWQRAKQGLRSQQQPSRSFEEVIETRGFARENDDGRNADRRLANRCVHASSAAGCEIGERCHTSSALAEEDRVK